MKEKIEKIVKYGVPIVVMLTIIFAFLTMSNAGSDPEFGAIGALDSFIFLIAFFLILYFIAGIIVWAITKKNFVFLSALFSIIITVVMVLFNNLRI